jgi:hypothetical protein
LLSLGATILHFGVTDFIFQNGFASNEELEEKVTSGTISYLEEAPPQDVICYFYSDQRNEKKLFTRLMKNLRAFFFESSSNLYEQIISLTNFLRYKSFAIYF